MSLTQADLLRLLRYDPESGKLYWRERPGDATFNTQFAGREALACPNDRGYLHGQILGHKCKAHRVIVCMMTGEWPPEVDHENGNKGDNRWANLRAVTSGEQAKNKKLRSDNRSGAVGVGWHKGAGKWLARIGKEYLGLFDTVEAAREARKAKEIEYGYHSNHGRAAAERAAYQGSRAEAPAR